MKHLSFILYLLIQFHVISAQPLQLNLALESGVSIPLFDFSGNRLQDGSFTMPGFTGSGGVTAIMKNRWEGFIQAGLQLLPVDVGALGQEKVAADPFLEDLYIRSEPFRVIHLLAGPGYQQRIGHTFLLEGRLAAGVFFSATPYQLYKAEYALLGKTTFEITSSRDVSFAWGADLQLIFELSPCYQLGLTNRFMQSKASYDFISGAGLRTDIRNISLWDISLSLIVKLFQVAG
ncbi:MAG: hypothetical protein V1775_08755 [Bacteroidota bacterium]